MNLYEEVVKRGLDVKLQFDPLLLKKVNELELSERTQNALKNSNIVYVGDLVTKTTDELLKTGKCGYKVLNEIRDVLRSYGLKFGMDVPEWLGGIDETESQIKLLNRAQKKNAYNELCYELFRELIYIDEAIYYADEAFSYTGGAFYTGDALEKIPDILREEIYRYVIRDYISSSNDYAKVVSARN